MIAPANKKIKDLEQLATLKNNDRSSQKAEIHSVLRDSNIYHGWNSNQNAFSFDFTKVFFLRNGAGLLDFMLHRVLSLASLKNLCCHNAIPHRLRGEWTRGSFWLHMCRLNVQQTLSFTSAL